MERETKAENNTRAVLDRTGITAPALGRKLNVPAERIRAWARDEASPPMHHQAALRAILERSQITELGPDPWTRGPRRESQLLCADSRTVLAELPEASVDMILSDIPYGIGLDGWDVLHANANAAYLGRSEAQERAGAVFSKRRKPINGWSAADRAIPAEYEAWCRSWAPDWLRVLRPGGSALVFAGRRHAHRAAVALEDAGFNLRDMLAWLRPRAVFRAQRLSLIYQKRGDLALARRWRGWRVGNLKPTFEPIIWCFKPYAVTLADNVLEHGVGALHAERFAELNGAAENVLRQDFGPGERGHHEAQKPIALLQALIELCTLPDQLVLDPFAGSASTALAARACGRRYLAIERVETLHQVAQARLASASRE